ncbi:nucleotidyltransferase family protein [Euzebya sp.]|uniref:nucleotidyltransferase family protein n=1 Tax=Euzebya sp. TaxID=1971409 RepID=UPI003513D69A
MLDHRDVLATLVAVADDGRLATICERHGVVVLGAHGSAVDGDRPARDLDLAVLLRPDASPDDVLALTEELGELLGDVVIDVMDLRQASPVARTHGLGGMPLYEDRPGRFAHECVAAWSERLDTAWLRRLEREVLAG